MAFRSRYSNLVKGRTKLKSRSGWEDCIKLSFNNTGTKYCYEPLDNDGKKIKIPYIIRGNYELDFVLLDNYIFVEAKGYLDREGELKMRGVKEVNPSLDIRFAFQNAHGKMQGKKMLRWQWAEKYGFKWSHAGVPDSWKKEPVCEANKQFLIQNGFKP